MVGRKIPGQNQRSAARKIPGGPPTVLPGWLLFASTLGSSTHVPFCLGVRKEHDHYFSWFDDGADDGAALVHGRRAFFLAFTHASAMDGLNLSVVHQYLCTCALSWSASSILLARTRSLINHHALLSVLMFKQSEYPEAEHGPG